MISFNIEGLKRQFKLLPKLQKKYNCDYMFLQETQTTSLEENDLINKMTVKGSVLRLNSWDKMEQGFNERIDNSTKRSKWGTGIVQYCEDEVTETDTGTDRFQILHTGDTVLVNVYFPVDKGKEGAEDYEVCLEALEQILKEEVDGKNLIIAGDVNYQPNHIERRRLALEKLCKAFNLKRNVPRETTYFGNNGDRSILDQCLVSEGVTNVSCKVLTGEHLPGNLSTHAAVLWTMNVKEEILPEKVPKCKNTEEEENKLFKRFARVNWEAGIDLDLYKIKGEAYLRVGLQAAQGLPAPWKMAILQDLMSEAADIARIRAEKTEEEEDNQAVIDIEKKIANKWREVKRRRSGYFSAGDARFKSIKRLREMYPQHGKKISEVAELEKEIAGLRRDLGRTVNTNLDIEMEDENEDLILALAEGRSRDFHSLVKNVKNVKNETPQAILHGGKWYYNDDVLNVFVSAAEEQSGETRNVPERKIDRRYVMRKECVRLREIMCTYDDKTRFMPLCNVEFDNLLNAIKAGKSQDIFGSQVEHFRFLDSDSKDRIRGVFNEVLSDISSYRHCLMSISRAVMVWKGKSKPKHLIKNHRRVQITPVPQKLIQELVSSQAINCVKAHQLSMQFGFSPGISFLQASVARECVSKYAVDKGDQVYLIAADVESAFSRTERICQLDELGFQGEFGKLFLFSVNFFANTKVVMGANKKFSAIFPEYLGAPQGALPSPRYFLQYTVPLDNYLNREKVGYEVAGHRYALLLVADDSMTFAKGKDQFKVTSRIYEHYAEEFGVKYGYEKINLNTYSSKGNTPDCEGLEFGGHPQKITEHSLHVGLDVCQNLKETERSNVAIRVAKAQNKTFAVMGRLWQEKKQIKLDASREVFRGVIKPTLTAGLAALCVEDTDMDPINKFCEKILRRTFRVREKAMVEPLYQILQVAPPQCDLHCQVFALLYNIWKLEGPVKDLVTHLLSDRSLKLKYWPMHVNNLCKQFVIPKIEDLFGLEPPSKAAFKGFANERIKNFYSDKLQSKIQRSSSLRLVHPEDFDFRSKKLSPLLTTAYTRREVIGMKINILHLIGEYKCGDNLARIRVRNNPSCDYCEDDFDNSEHAILKCGILKEVPAVWAQLQLIKDWLQTELILSKGEIDELLESNPDALIRWILNPLSKGNLSKLILIQGQRNLCNLIRLCQELILLSHNARTRAKRIRGGTRKSFGVLSKKTGTSRLSRGRDNNLPPSGNRRITNYFSLKSNNRKAARNPEESSALTYQYEDAERMAHDGTTNGEDNGCQLLAMVVNGHVTPIVTCKTEDWGKRIFSRSCVIRFQQREGHNKLTVFSCKNTKILNSLEILTIGQFGPEALADFAQYAPFLIGEIPQNNWTAEVPAWIVWSSWPSDLKIHLLKTTSEMNWFQITMDEGMAWSTCEEPYMHEDDYILFRKSTWRFDTRRVENLWRWAQKHLKSGTYNLISLNENDTMYGEAWDHVTRMLEYSSPGRAVTMAKELRVKGPVSWNTDLAVYMSNISSNGFWSSQRPPKDALATIVDDLSPSNGLVRYNTEPITAAEKRWWTDRQVGPDTCEKDRLRELYGNAVEHVNVLKTELTQLNRTADLFQKRNSDLHEELAQVKRQLNESERKRYAMSSSSSTDDGSEEKEERKITKIVHKVLQATRATSNVPPALSREERVYYGLAEEPYHSPKDPREGGLPGQRKVVEKDEPDPVFERAKAKLERMSAEKAAAAAANSAGESTPRKVNIPQATSSASTAPLMAWGAKQGSAAGPAVTIMAKKRSREPTSSTSSEEASTRPKPAFRNSAQGAAGTSTSSTIMKKATGTSKSSNPAKKAKKKTPPPYHPETKFSLALARAGACKARWDIPENERVGDNGVYKSEDEETENLRAENEAEPVNVVENPATEPQEPAEEEAITPNNSAHEDVLIINAEEHDKLDFEPEEVDEKILDDTVDAKVHLFNTLLNLRSDFRTRTAMPGRSEALPNPRNLVPKKRENVHEWNINDIFIYLINYSLFMKQLILYLFILCSQSVSGANQYQMSSCLLLCANKPTQIKSNHAEKL